MSEAAPVEMTKLSPAQVDASKWRQIFESLDTNSDGLVSVSELRDALLRSGGQPLSITEAQVDQLLKSTDQNQNGIIEFDEFLAMVGLHKEVARSLYERTMESIGQTWVPLSGRQYAKQYYTCKPPPVFIIGISILQILTFIVLACITDTDWISDCPGCWMEFDGEVIPGPLTFNGAYRILIYPFISYAFMHKGIVHIYGNLFLQLLVGVPLEIVHKWRVIVLYLMSVITGAMFAHVITPSGMLVGASGGVFGLVAAAIAQTIMNWSDMPEPWLRVLFAGGYLLNNVIYTAVIMPIQTPYCQSASWSCHLGGALTGFLFGVYILKNFQVRPWEIKFRRICLAIYVAIFILLFIGWFLVLRGSLQWESQ